MTERRHNHLFKDMKNYKIDDLKFQFAKLNYKWLPFHIVGIRSDANNPDKFDDLIGLIEKDNLVLFSGTTNPGTHWLKNLLNPKGAALLKPNQYLNTYQLDLHQGKYTALCQRKPVTVYRDANKNNFAEESSVTDTGLFGINIHRANPSAVSSIIDKWSAGCQVLNDPIDFNFLIKRCKESGLKEFTYTLLKEF
jgi:hypothetical protein